MTSGWKAGEPGSVLFEAVDGSRRAIAARFQRNRDSCYEFLLDMPAGEACERPVMVALGAGPEQRFAPILKSSHQGDVLTVWTPDPWYRSSGRRCAPRYPVWLPCIISAGEISAQARCLDLSFSGAAIESAGWHPPVFSLAIQHRDRTLSIACRTVSVQACGPLTVIHAAFVDVPEPSVSDVSELVDYAREEFLEAQMFLAGRANDGIPHFR